MFPPMQSWDIAEECGDRNGFWVRANPSAINLFCNPLEHLRNSGWHEVGSDGQFDLDRMVTDNKQCLVHSVREQKAGRRGQLNWGWQKLYFRPSDRIFVRVGTDFCEFGNLSVWAITQEEAQLEFQSWWNKYWIKPKRRRTAPRFEIITLEDGRPSTSPVDVVMAFPTLEEDLALHYGAEFPVWLAQYRQALRTRRSGLTLFRGEPGTGKTTLLRHLISKLRRTQRFYYLPTDSHDLITDPRMAEFWFRQNLEYPRLRKVIILEDAEPLLMERSADNRAAVSNMLNVADGLMGEFLNLHLICTINCEIEKLDPAVVRSGRLVDSWEFRRLTAAEARKLSVAKGLRLAQHKDDYSLAEIYNGAGRVSAGSRGKSIGFLQEVA